MYSTLLNVTLQPFDVAIELNSFIPLFNKGRESILSSTWCNINASSSITIQSSEPMSDEGELGDVEAIVSSLKNNSELYTSLEAGFLRKMYDEKAHKATLKRIIHNEFILSKLSNP